MVVISLPPTRPTCVMHERVATPSTRTVHAPHWPSPQPYLLPVRSRSLRRTESRLTDESISTAIFLPLTLSEVTFAIVTSCDAANLFEDWKGKYNSAFARL